jgi:hypothetical protein
VVQETPKVYVVVDAERDALYKLIGVFSTETAAQEAMDKYEKTMTPYRRRQNDELGYNEVELDRYDFSGFPFIAPFYGKVVNE